MSEYRVGPSEIHGRGVFSTKEYRRGELVGVYEGIITRRHIRSRFFLTMGEHEGVVWGVQGTNDLKHMNSERDPSCRLADDCGIYALKRIRPDDELTFDYEFGGG